MSLMHVWRVVRTGQRVPHGGRRCDVIAYVPPGLSVPIETQYLFNEPVGSPAYAYVSTDGSWWRVVVYLRSTHQRVGGYRVRRYKDEGDGHWFPETENAARRAFERPRIAAAIQLAAGDAS